MISALARRKEAARTRQVRTEARGSESMAFQLLDISEPVASANHGVLTSGGRSPWLGLGTDHLKSIALSVLGFMDGCRATLLRTTLAWAPLRPIFSNRALRLLVLYLIALCIYLPASVLFPLWILILGPIFWGLPHLLASVRFTHDLLNDRGSESEGPTRARLLKCVGLVWVAVVLSRLLQGIGGVPLFFGAGQWPEVLSMVVTVIACGTLYRKSWPRLFLAMGTLTPLVFLFWRSPLWIAGAMVLLHNAIAFVYWVRSSRSRSERRVAWIGSALFVLANILIFEGAFDGLSPGLPSAESIDWAGMDSATLGHWILPASENPRDWHHAVVAFAFGQSLHYFVWLKAIPDQLHSYAVSPGFRQSYQLYVKDYGTKLAHLLLLLCIAGFGMWAFLGFEMARQLYFAFAAYHGFFEIACLSLMIGPRS